MTFARVKPDGWAVNEELSSAQINALDIDHADAVDKTGDTVPGVIEFDSGAEIVLNLGAAFTAESGAVADFDAGSTVTVGGAFNVVGGDVDLDSASTFAVDCVALFNGAATHAANVTLNNSANLIVAGSSGVLIQGGASIAWANTANASFQAGSTATVQNGAFLTVASGGTLTLSGIGTIPSGGVLTVASSGSIVVASGGAITVPGAVNFTSTGSATWADGTNAQWASGSTCAWFSGAVVTFANVPTFSAGLTASGGTTSLSGTITVPGSATFGGTVLTNGAVNFSGTTTIFGAPNKLKCTVRQVIRKLNLANVRFGIMFFAGGIGQSPLYNSTDDVVLMKLETPGAAAQDVSFPVDIPHNSVLTRIEVDIDATSDAATAIKFFRSTSLVDDIASPAPTGVNVLTMTETINRTFNTYRIVVASTSAGGLKTCTINSITLFYNVSEYDEG